MKIFQDKDNEKVIQEAAKELNRLLGKAKGQPILLLLSGGSSLELISGIEIKNLGEHVTIGMLDERFSEDAGVNNFSQFASADFYWQAKDVGCRYIDTRIRHGETLNLLAERFDAELKNWNSAHPHGMMIATIGIGPDGHVAGIMPYPENPEKFIDLFDNLERWGVGYDATKEKNDYPLRVTVTLPFLRMVDYGVTYMAGENKRNALKQVLRKEGTLWETPGRILREMKDVMVFTDIVD